jgi:hypothetical protein
MACGTPVVAVREGGIPESVVHEVGGILADRDEKQFAQVIERLLHSPDLRSKLGTQARDQVVRRWTWDQAAARLEAFLLEAIRQPPRPAEAEQADPPGAVARDRRATVAAVRRLIRRPPQSA